MTGVTIEIHDEEVMATLNRLLHAVDDLSPALDAIGQEMESRVSARFGTESDPGGAPWAPWMPSTVKSYPKDGNRRILDRTSDMLGSLNHQVSGDAVEIGFGQPYAVFHEFGTGKMKRRGLLTTDPVAGTLGDGDQESILDILNQYIQGAIDG